MRNTLFVRPCCGTFAILATATVLCGASMASAGVISITSDTDASTEGLGAFSGSLEYNSDIFTSTGTLTVMLTNNSDAANGGYLTGFVFNVNGADPSADISLISADYPFQFISNASAAPFGTYDAGAALGGNWLGGGAPHAGIGVGETGVFEFLIAASNATSLTVEDFLGNHGSNGFVARFRGFENGGSDKVPGVNITAIPAPAVMGLFLAAGLAGRRRRN